jgi:hypothetical protein
MTKSKKLIRYLIIIGIIFLFYRIAILLKPQYQKLICYSFFFWIGIVLVVALVNSRKIAMSAYWNQNNKTEKSF